MEINKHMVETAHLNKEGIKKGALKKDGSDVLFLNSKWNKICAPKEKKSGKMFALVFWNKSDPKDKPGWNNQVSSCSYGHYCL
jgi:hypothetical protein